MIISIDTQKMGAIVAAANDVCVEIDACVSALLPVVEHNDWNCKERDAINDGITAVKGHVRQLQETTTSFANMVQRTADMFDAFELAVPNRYQALDTVLGTVFSESCAAPTTSCQTGALGTEIASTIAQDFRVDGGLANNAIGNLTTPIQLCEFSTVDFSDV